ncbi:hypothetical protein [Variovorax rhizosphaerae]|uniref:Uncharacterized protein n=1 Tax=Variovorax rhizosphaerae TaxID=1836200 RepID=A0ABU8WF61_9BURK
MSRLKRRGLAPFAQLGAFNDASDVWREVETTLDGIITASAARASARTKLAGMSHERR